MSVHIISKVPIFAQPLKAAQSTKHEITLEDSTQSPLRRVGASQMQNANLSFQAEAGLNEQPMDAPPVAVYSSFDELLVGGNNWAVAHGYKLVVVRSKTNAAGHKTWVHLACDRHGRQATSTQRQRQRLMRLVGTKRNTHNLTPETRKKNRRSRRCECPMYCVAVKQQNDLWELNTRNHEHNHGPYEPPQAKKKGVLVCTFDD